MRVDQQMAYAKNKSILSRKVGDEFILVPIGSDVADLESIYRMNETAAFIWESIDGKRNVAQIIRDLVEIYDVDAEEAKDDVQRYLEQLKKINAIQSP